uniref:3-hydroxyanthranilate 3,4-dioxygenase n=1 Tax=Aplanochytrium stocchinoi TaxID=215587 RepID=A0A7S3PML7_9STRA
MGGDKRVLVEPTNIEQWYKDNKELFSPPICNKLLHKGQMTVMFVGGPNTRTDFHLDQGSEFFWMLKGGMELPIIQQGKRKLVKINEGEVFLLPPRVPHSPQRPQQGSLGLVVERERNKSENEVDGLRWYTDFNNCDQILWERYFYCGDLGRDLVPVVKAYKESEECRSRIPGENLCKRPPFEQNTTDAVPEPFNLKEWIERNRKELSQGKTLRLFPESHPCPEMNILVQGESKTELIQRCKIFGKCFLMVISSLLHFCLQFYDITIV